MLELILIFYVLPIIITWISAGLIYKYSLYFKRINQFIALILVSFYPGLNIHMAWHTICVADQEMKEHQKKVEIEIATRKKVERC